MVEEKTVKKYYEKVKGYYEDLDIWTDVTRKFPPKTIEIAVRRTLEKCEEMDLDPELLDWKDLFYQLQFYDKVDAFIEEMVSPRVLLKIEEKKAREMALSELERMASDLGMKIVKEEELELVEKAKLYEAKVKELEAQIKKLRDDIRKLEESERRARLETEKLKDKLRREYEEKLKELKAKVFRMVVVKIRRPCEKFVGADGKEYGPFSLGAIATVPEPDAVRLIGEGVAETWIEARRRELKELTDEELRRLEEMFKDELARRLGRVPKGALRELSLELRALRELGVSFEEAKRRVVELAGEIASRGRILPEVPVSCPIDGSPLEELSKVPVAMPVELTAEEEYLRRRLGIPVPDKGVVWLDVPPTIKLFMCKEGHMFERDPKTGELVERTPEYVYREIVRETAKIRKVTAPRLVELTPTRRWISPPPSPPRGYIAPFGVIPISTRESFVMWLQNVKKMSLEEYSKLDDDERKKIIDEWVEFMRKFG